MMTDWNKGKPEDKLSMENYRASIILKQVMLNGKYKIYEDHTRQFLKIEILLDNQKTIILYKQVAKNTLLARFKELQIFSPEKHVLDSMYIMADDHLSTNPIYHFYFLNSIIGSGKGDIGLFIASKLLGDEGDMRYLMGSNVDDAVLQAIRESVARNDF